MAVCYTCKTLDVEHIAARVGDSLSEESLGVGTESAVDFLIRSFLTDEGAVNTEFLECDTEEVIGATIDFVGNNNVITCLTDIEYCIEIGCLTAACEHCPYSSFERSYLLCYSIVGRILQTGIEIALLLQIEEVCHFLCVVILESCTLKDWKHTRFTILWLPPCLYAKSGSFKFVHNYFKFLSLQFRFPFHIIVHEEILSVEHCVGEERIPLSKNHHTDITFEEYIKIYVSVTEKKVIDGRM